MEKISNRYWGGVWKSKEDKSFDYWQEVQGIPVIIKGLEDVDLFAHLTILKNEKNEVVYNENCWSISEGITGLSIVFKEESMDNAICILTILMALKRNRKRLKEEIKNTTNISPRYKKEEVNNGI